MIYTIGYTKSYEKSFEDHSIVFKKGRDKDYEGGSVWKTYEEAVREKPEGYSVYGVLADWETETIPSEGNSWHCLLVDAKLEK